MRPRPYERTGHAADVGLRVRGRTPRELFTHAALGLFDLMTDIRAIRNELDEGRPGIRRSIILRGSGTGGLLFAWLRELLFIFSARRIAFARFRFLRLTARELKVSAVGRKFDPACHQQKLEVKAVTYHRFRVSRDKDKGWTAEIIFDV